MSAAPHSRVTEPARVTDGLRIAILISGRGSNMVAIAHACAEGRIAAHVCGVIADRAGAGGIALAEGLGIRTHTVEAARYPQREAFEDALAAVLEQCGAELVVLAGFMRILSAAFVQRYAGRMLNIHPSLLPKHKGLHTHRRVLEAGDAEHGISVHYVTAELDGGPVIWQARLRVLPDDNEQTLLARVQRLEHRIYPQVVGLIAERRLQLAGGTIRLDGRPLSAPIQQDEQDVQTPVPA